MQERRLERIEAELSGEQRVLAWLEQVRSIGFLDYGIRSVRRELRPQVELADEQSKLLYHLIIECNDRAQALQDVTVGRLIAAYLLRLWHTREQPLSETEAECCVSECVRRALTDFIVAGESLAGAVQRVGALHFGGREILLCDSKKALEERRQAANTLLAGYNAISEKTTLPPISQEDLQSEIADETEQVIGTMEGLTRARLELGHGNSLAAAEAMAKIPVLRFFDAPAAF